MIYRLIKQLVYIFIYCVIFFLAGWGAYKLFINRPTCFDAKQNQNETGIDCGGPCPSCEIFGVPDPEVLWKKLLPATTKFSNLVIAMQNKTVRYGAENIDYRVKLIGADGRLIHEITNKIFILPSQIKYLIIPNIPILAKDAADIQFNIEKIKWRTINVDNWLLSTRDVKARFSMGSDLGYITIEGKVINRGAVMLDSVAVRCLLFDKNKPPEAAAAGSTNVYTLLPNEERHFIITIPQAIPGLQKEDIDLTNIDTQADSNLFLYY